MCKGGLSTTGRSVKQQPSNRPDPKALRQLRMAQGHDNFHHQLLYHRIHPSEIGEPRPLLPSDDSFRGRGLRLSISAGTPISRDEAARLICRNLNLQLLVSGGVPFGCQRGVVGAEHGLGDVVGGDRRWLGGLVGDGGGGGGAGVGIVAAAAEGGGIEERTRRTMAVKGSSFWRRNLGWWMRRVLATSSAEAPATASPPFNMRLRISLSKDDWERPAPA
ncbi:unnamed protein product [Urochloa humidicola]